jgi:RNA polymerase subunit RPABC4/transcription elongation factor Spt4
MNCTQCQSEVSDTQNFCPNCGAKIWTPTISLTNTTPKSDITKQVTLTIYLIGAIILINAFKYLNDIQSELNQTQEKKRSIAAEQLQIDAYGLCLQLINKKISAPYRIDFEPPETTNNQGRLHFTWPEGRIFLKGPDGAKYSANAECVYQINTQTVTMLKFNGNKFI